jgi:transposase
MTKNSILGLDIAQNTAVAQLDRADGTRCWRETLTTDQAGWQHLESLCAAHGATWATTRVLLEATGVYHLPWAERLTRAGAEVYVLNPLLAARLQSAANALREHKTDHVDVHRLCEAGRLYADQLGRFRYRPEPDRQGLKQLDHARATLRTTLTNLRKSLRSQLELVFPALLKAKIGPYTQQAAAILETAPTAGLWRALSSAERRRLAGAKQAALDHACAETLADEALAQACVPAVRALLGGQQAIRVQLEACDQQIAPRLPAERVALLRSIPGFGERTAAVLAVYLPAGFANWGKPKQITARLQALFGTDPRLRQSGQWTGRVKISKRGIGAARTALFQAAFCSLATDPETAAYYQALRQGDGRHRRPKAHKEAIVDVMRKQLRRLVSVLLANQPFVAKSPLAA